MKDAELITRGQVRRSRTRRDARFAASSPWQMPICAVVLSLVLGLVVAACAKPADVTEPGALLLRVRSPAGGTPPDELRVSVYDDGGALFKNVRVPEQGALMAVNGSSDLGTILIQPGVSRGQLRVHVRGLRGGARAMDGVARIPAEARKRGYFQLLLEAAHAQDMDGDDVPDAIDNCQAQANPDQKGCGADAGSGDGPSGEPGDGAGGGTSGEGSAAGAGGGIGSGGDMGTGGVMDVGGRGGLVGSGGVSASGGVIGGGGGVVGTGGVVGSGGVSSSGGTGTGGAPIDAGVTDGGAGDGPRRALGTACNGGSQCASNYCADGVCCQTACNQACQVCAAGTGKCGSVTSAQDRPQCWGNRTCDSASRCVNQ